MTKAATLQYDSTCRAFFGEALSKSRGAWRRSVSEREAPAQIHKAVRKAGGERKKKEKSPNDQFRAATPRTADGHKTGARGKQQLSMLF